MRSVLIDYLTPKGHIPIINFYIKELNNEFKLIYLNENINTKIKKKKNLFFLKIKKNFILRFFQILCLFKKFKKHKIKKILMLSYEPYIMFLLSLFINLSNFEIFVFEHDTLNPKNKFKFFLIRFLNKKITHLVYQSEQKKLLKFKFKRKAIITNHPIIKNSLNKYETKKKIILIPTRHHFKKELINNFIKKNLKYNFIILAKSSNIKKNLFVLNQNIEIKEYITNKDIAKIFAIYLPLDPIVYKYRISSWVYMGIAYNKKIILDYNSIYKFEKKRFPSYIILNKPKNLELIKLQKNNINWINKYNNTLIKKLRKCIISKN